MGDLVNARCARFYLTRPQLSSRRYTDKWFKTTAVEGLWRERLLRRSTWLARLLLVAASRLTIAEAGAVLASVGL